MSFVFTSVLTLTQLRRFRWVYCQIETLRRCFLASLRRALDELPETLDGTYEQTLRGIDKHKRDYAIRLFQCLVVSKRPLRVEELAELFAIEHNAETIPTFNSSLRPENPEELILSACSTLVAVVNINHQKFVQFSHFSVREYLTSNRIAISDYVSRFHVLPRPAHALFARACLAVLFQLDSDRFRVNIRNFPLAPYAARYWIDHARFENVSSVIEQEIECLFDRNKPYLKSWFDIYTHDTEHSSSNNLRGLTSPSAVPLYYVAFCGFYDIAEHLLDAHPQDVNAWGGEQVAPLDAAVCNGHLSVVVLLVERGADIQHRNSWGNTPLHTASSCGYAEIASFLIDRGADINARSLNPDRTTPLHLALKYDHDEIVRLLLDRGSDANRPDGESKTSLHYAIQNGHNITTVKLLLDHGALTVVDFPDKYGRTPLHYALQRRYNDIVQLLLDYDADPNYPDSDGMALLHHASQAGNNDIVQLLLHYDGAVNLQDSFGWTPRDHASMRGHYDTAQLLRENGAHANYSHMFVLTGIDFLGGMRCKGVSNHISILGIGSNGYDRTQLNCECRVCLGAYCRFSCA